MPLTYILILLVIVLFLIIFIYIEPIIAKYKIKNENEYGSARFATFKEIKHNFTKEPVSHIEEAGFPIWFSNNLEYVWFDKETPHYVYLGSTGSGKSVTAVIPECSFIATSNKKRSVFITDPKGEIFNKTSKMFESNGYKIITIDFRHPELSNKFNVLQPIINEFKKHLSCENEKNKLIDKINIIKEERYKYSKLLSDIKISKKIKKEIKKKIKESYEIISNTKNDILDINNKSLSHYAETNRLITSLSNMITQEKTQQKDPFWNNSARQLLEGLIGFFLEEYKIGNIEEKQITMNSIRNFQNSSMENENSKKFKSYIETKEYGSKSKDSLTSILSASDNTLKSITAVFGEKMALFDDINVANVTSCSDFEFDCLGKEPTALYVIVPDEDKTYYTLVTIIVGLLYKELVKLANSREDKKLEYQIDWILDEFANCPPLADIEAIVSVARSRGMRFQFFIQSFSQLDNVYGKEVSQIILDNCGLVYLKTNTQDTAEAISKRLGKKTIEANSISQSVSLLNYNGNKSTSLIARDLMTPDEVKQLHYKTIIFPIIGYPIIRDTVMYNKFKCYSDGEVTRKIKHLRNLTDTYFTVENIKYDYQPKRGRLRQLVDKKEVSTFNNDLEEFYNKLFEPVYKIFDEVFKDTIYESEILENNNKKYFSAIFDNVPNGNIIKLKSKISQDTFHVETIKENDKVVINIHTKSI